MPGVTEPIAKIMSPLPRHARRSQWQLSKILIRVLQVSNKASLGYANKAIGGVPGSRVRAVLTQEWSFGSMVLVSGFHPFWGPVRSPERTAV